MLKLALRLPPYPPSTARAPTLSPSRPNLLCRLSVCSHRHECVRVGPIRGLPRIFERLGRHGRPDARGGRWLGEGPQGAATEYVLER